MPLYVPQHSGPQHWYRLPSPLQRLSGSDPWFLTSFDTTKIHWSSITQNPCLCTDLYIPQSHPVSSLNSPPRPLELPQLPLLLSLMASQCDFTFCLWDSLLMPEVASFVIFCHLCLLPGNHTACLWAPWVQWVLPSSNFCSCCFFTRSSFSSLCLADSIHSDVDFVLLISVSACLFPLDTYLNLH